jgi:1-acyl-sn-glycerol-3-phosphate acyltransferase
MPSSIDHLRRRTPPVLRVARAARVALHVIRGIATTVFVFPRVGIASRETLIRSWSTQLLRMMHVEARVEGLPEAGLPGNLLIVANHVSWLDIFVVDSIRPARFIAKAEVKRWPLIGRLVAGCGTLFLDRERRRHAHRVNQEARDVLAAGDTIAIFPEGTTTDGKTVLPFHSSLLQPIIDAQGHVLPVAIRYCALDGTYDEAPVYVGETTFLKSLWRVLGERNLVVEVKLGPPLATSARDRRELTREAETFIQTALGSSPRGSAPGIRAHRRA